MLVGFGEAHHIFGRLPHRKSGSWLLIFSLDVWGVRKTTILQLNIKTKMCYAKGCAGVIVGHPLDTVKIHLQTQDFKNPKYRGSLHCLKTLVQTQGVRGVYRGMSSPLAGVAAINAVVFGVQGNVQRSCSDPDSLRTHALAGATAGFMQSFVCSPMELAKSRLQVETKGSVGPSQLLAQIYRSDGVRGVFKGLNLTVAREVPSYAAYFWTYEALTRSQTGVVSTFDMLMAGGLAGSTDQI